MSGETKDDAENFLSRWSRRKVEAKVEPDPVKSAGLPSSASAQNMSVGALPKPEMPETPRPTPGLPYDSESPPLPAIDSLTHEADFTPFMAKDIDPALRNQAMKKLFADPHYGFDKMDKLDIYIDDYSKSDPIPLDVLKKMYQSKSLFLFDEEEKAADTTASVPVSAPPTEAAPAEAVIDKADVVTAPAANTHTIAVGNSDATRVLEPHVAPPDRLPTK